MAKLMTEFLNIHCKTVSFITDGYDEEYHQVKHNLDKAEKDLDQLYSRLKRDNERDAKEFSNKS
jgi:Skp family chaperone for outer membrane proteins